MRAPIRSATIIATLLTLGTGCGEDALAPVSGVVLLDGKPLAGGVVNFQPIGGEEENPGPGSTGIIDKEGRYELKTPDGTVGAVIGRHKVRIYSRNAEAPPGQDFDTRPTVELVPYEYNYRTKLTFDVLKEGTDEADFDLKTDGK